MIQVSSNINNWELVDSLSTKVNGDSAKDSTLPIYAERLPNVPGTHILSFESAVDSIKLEHEAKNREGFAIGAIVAAEWLIGKTGVFGMSDLLNFEN